MDYKHHFPIYTAQPDLVYLDTAASSLTPQCVLDAVSAYYTQYPVNIHRGLYPLSVQATQAYEQARVDVANFIGASRDEVVFTSGTTQSLNMLAAMIKPRLMKGKNIVLTRYEHHANLIPWQRLAQETGAELRYIELTEEYAVDMRSAQQLITQETVIVAFGSVSNALGTIAPAQELVQLAHAQGALAFIDAAQQVAHTQVRVADLQCDALVFSGHKMYGPSGIGVLYANKALLDWCEPVQVGGDMIKEVSYERASWASAPQKYEAGTPNIAGAIGLAAAVRFLRSIGWEKIAAHEHRMQAHVSALIKEHGDIIGPHSRVGVTSFGIGPAHPHDIAEIFARDHVAIRAGHHCTQPLMRHLNRAGTARVSTGIYTDDADLRALERALKEGKKILT